MEKSIKTTTVEELDQLAKQASRKAIERLVEKGVGEIDDNGSYLSHQSRSDIFAFDELIESGKENIAKEVEKNLALGLSITIRNKAGQLVEIRRGENGELIETPLLREKN